MVAVNEDLVRATYAQNWPAYNKAQCREKLLFMKLLFELCSDIEVPRYEFGRPRIPLSDMIFCSVFKVYSTYSGRRFKGDMWVAKKMDYIREIPHYNSIFNCMKRRETGLILKSLITKSAKTLRLVENEFATDSTGFSTSRFDRWFNLKHGRSQERRKWLKAHIMSGVKTNIVTSVEVTDGVASDTKQFRYLLADTVRNFKVNEISADKAYSSRENFKQLKELEVTPYIPFKKNTNPKSRGLPFWNKMWHYYNLKREEFLKHYHKRSNVEATFHMIKTKFGSQLKSRTRTAQINETLLKILCHNIVVLIHKMHEINNKIII